MPKNNANPKKAKKPIPIHRFHSPPLFWHGKCFAIILFLTKRSKDCTLYQHLILRFEILITHLKMISWIMKSSTYHSYLPWARDVGGMHPGCIVKRNHDSLDSHLIWKFLHLIPQKLQHKIKQSFPFQTKSLCFLPFSARLLFFPP